MAKTFTALRMQLGGATAPELLPLSIDPRTAGGVAAQLGTLGFFQGPPVQLFVKVGAAATAWLPLGAQANVQAFTYTATGAEGSDFTVNLPATRSTDTYVVIGALAGVAAIFEMDFPDILAGDRTTALFRVVTTGALTVGDKIDFLITEKT